MLRHRGKAAITLRTKNQTKTSSEKDTKDTTPPSYNVVKPIVLLSLFVGYMPKRFKIPGIFGGLLWLVSLFLHTTFDFMSARKLYGYAWASIQILLFFNLVMCTYSVRRKVVPWLETSLSQLDNENKYLKTFARIRKLFRIIPWVVILFSVLGTGIQFFCFYYDGAFSVSFEQPVSKGWEITLLVVWFITNVHLLFAFSFFWCVTACNMYTTGYSMTEYHDMMTAHLKNKESPFTFRQAVHSFAERGSFLKTSASVCRISLAFLLVYSIASLAVNAFYYLYKARKAGYIFFALMPPICSVYPLCLAAWVTKQYKWYLAVVVKAWAERPESTDEEEESGSDQPRNKNKNKAGRKLTKRVKSARRKDESDGNKPRRRSIFARAKPAESGSLSDTENDKEKKKNAEKPRRRSLFVRAKPLSGDSDYENDPEKKNKFREKPRRRSLFARAKPLPGGSYSDTEGYPEKKNDKPRRGSLFVRPKSASTAVPFFDNKGFSPEKKVNFPESPQTKKTFFAKDDTTRFTSVSDTEMISEDEDRPRNSEFKPGTETAKTNWNRLIKSTTDDGDKRHDAEDQMHVEMPTVRPPIRLKPLGKTLSISENEELTESEYENDVKPKDVRQKVISQSKLKPSDARRPTSENEATDDENLATTDSGDPNAIRQIEKNKLKPSDIRQTISDDEATDDEKNPNTNDSKPKVNRQRVMELILRGTARAVGRLQHRAKLPKFNFEKYISYLQNVLPTIGFKIMGITVTWEMVSTILFLEVSLLALFMQESIFGNQKAQVSL